MELTLFTVKVTLFVKKSVVVLARRMLGLTKLIG